LFKDFKNKTALITGAASGLGLEFSKKAASLGMHLLLIDVHEDRLKQASQEIESVYKQTGIRIKYFSVDVSNCSEMESVSQEIFKHHPTPNLVINNAGISGGGLIWEHTSQDWERVLGVNLMGVINGVRLFTPLMLKAAKLDPAWRGHIVNTASMAGLLTPPNMGIYNVSKHGVMALTETLFQDLALVTEQISASVLCPYFVPTSINQSFYDSTGVNAGPEKSVTQSQLIGKQMLDKAVNSGKVSAAEIAAVVFEAVENNQFYIFSHPHALENVRERMVAILDNKQPPDPFAKRPQIGLELKSALRA
jgi:short-subunit dehydrogenase